MKFDPPVADMMRRVTLANYIGNYCPQCGFHFATGDAVAARNARIVTCEPFIVIVCDDCWPTKEKK